MRAIVYSEFGPPEVLALADIDRPTPKPNEVLVRIRAAAANPLDWHFIRGEPSVMRLMGKPRKRVPGVDFSGQVEAVGANVTELRAGDDVFGMGSGTFAEYACASSKAIARKPSALTHEQAAAIPVAGTTALIALRDKGELRAGQRVLVVGAAGGVGTFAVQIAKALGAHVTGGGGIGRNTGGSQTLATLCALALVTARHPFSRLWRQRIRMFVAKARSSDLTYLAELCGGGKLTPYVERT